jgi:hypothetical protein
MITKAAWEQSHAAFLIFWSGKKHQQNRSHKIYTDMPVIPDIL